MSGMIERVFRVDTEQPMVRQRLRDVLVKGDRSAHRIRVELNRGGTPLTGLGQVHGYAVRPDGVTVVAEGSAADNCLEVTLPPACYDVPGRVELLLRVEKGDTILTALWLEMLVAGGVTDEAMDPGSIVPSLSDLLSQLGRMETATGAAEGLLDTLQPYAALAHLPLNWAVDTRIDVNTGLATADTNYCATLPIAIAGGFAQQVEVLTACANDSSAAAFYDEEQQPLSFANVYDGTGLSLARHVLDVPEGARYFRFSCRKKNDFYLSAAAFVKTPASEVAAAIRDLTATRSELKSVQGALLQAGDQELTEQNACFEKRPGCYADTKGNLVTDAGFDTYVMQAAEDFHLYGTPSQLPSSKYVSVALFDGALETACFRKRYRSYKTENTMPTAGEPLTVKRGTVLAISVHADLGFALMCDSSLASGVLADGVQLGTRQLQQVESAMAGTLEGLDLRLSSLDARLVETGGFQLLTLRSTGWESRPGCYVDAKGNLVASDEYDTWVREAKADYNLYAPTYDPGEYISLALFGGEVAASQFVGRYRSYKTENTLPAEASPLHVTKGQLVAVTVFHGGEVRLYSDDAFAASTLARGVALGEAQLAQLDAYLPRSGRLFQVSGEGEDVFFNLPTDRADVTLRYRFSRVVDEAKRMDCWCLRTVQAMQGDTVLYPVVTEGNWELAVKQQGATDFVGGRQHGYEITTDIAFRMDGAAWKIGSGSSMCRELAVEESSLLYDLGGRELARHEKRYTITAEGIDLSQRLTWLQSTACDLSYVCMLPLVRGNDTVTPYQISDSCRDNLDFVDYAIGTPGFTGRPHQKKHGVTRYWLWSTQTGVQADVACQMEEEPEDSVSFVQNTANQYNKVYFSYCGENHQVAAGETWRWRQKYRLNVCSPTISDAEEALRLALEAEQPANQTTLQRLAALEASMTTALEAIRELFHAGRGGNG